MSETERTRVHPELVPYSLPNINMLGAHSPTRVDAYLLGAKSMCLSS